MSVHLCLVDDWELRGDGSGNMQRIQFDQMRTLSALYEKYGFKGTFNVEVMQQLYHLKFGEKYSRLRDLAKEWEEVVLETYEKGHDMQLHIHSQWDGAEYNGSHWQLDKNWAITNLEKERKKHLINECKAYLENLIHKIDPSYECISFRSGAWAVAPDPDMMTLLSDAGIIFDMSLVNGLYYDLPMVQLDYRNLPEPFFPYYPVMDDARKVSSKNESIVCCPTHSFKTHCFRYSILMVLKAIYPKYALAPKHVSISSSNVSSNYSNKWKGDKSIIKILYEHIKKEFIPITLTSDISQLTYIDFLTMLNKIKKKTNKKETPVPIIFENHTKDIGTFNPIELLCDKISKDRSLKVLTAREIAMNIKNNIYEIKKNED